MGTEHNSNQQQYINLFSSNIWQNQKKWMCSRQQMKFQTGRWIYILCVFFTEWIAVETKTGILWNEICVLIKDGALLCRSLDVCGSRRLEWDSIQRKKCRNVAWMEFRGQNSLVGRVLRIRNAVALAHTFAHQHFMALTFRFCADSNHCMRMCST